MLLIASNEAMEIFHCLIFCLDIILLNPLNLYGKFVDKGG